MYAVIETGGKQYRVEVGTELEVELLDVRARRGDHARSRPARRRRRGCLDRPAVVDGRGRERRGRPPVTAARSSIVQVPPEGPQPRQEGPSPGADGPARSRDVAPRRPQRRERRSRRPRQRRRTERETPRGRRRKQAAARTRLSPRSSRRGTSPPETPRREADAVAASDGREPRPIRPKPAAKRRRRSTADAHRSCQPGTADGKAAKHARRPPTPRAKADHGEVHRTPQRASAPKKES